MPRHDYYSNDEAGAAEAAADWPAYDPRDDVDPSDYEDPYYPEDEEE